MNRKFYAELLVDLYEHSSDSAGEALRVTDLIAETGDFIDRHTTPDTTYDAEAEAQEAGAAVRSLALRQAKGEAYPALKGAGWLIELRYRYCKLVDLSPGGRLLLRELNIRNAFRFSQEFVQHLRTLSARRRIAAPARGRPHVQGHPLAQISNRAFRDVSRERWIEFADFADRWKQAGGMSAWRG